MLIAAGAWQPVTKAFVRIAEPNGDQLHAASFGTRTWRVRFEKDALLAATATPRPAQLPFSPDIDTSEIEYFGTQPNQFLRVRGGWLLSYYHGEFGGGLWQFNGDGSVGRRLLSTPAFGLIRYGNDVLVETPDNTWTFRHVRIHRFTFQNGQWEEIAHTDFSRAVGTLYLIRGQLYTIVTVLNQSTMIAAVDLSGNFQVKWRTSGDVRVAYLAQASNGDFALSAKGYILRLHRVGNDYVATWFAPRDCVRYTNTTELGIEARCAGLPGVQSFARHRHFGIVSQASRDGNWLLLGGRLLQFIGNTWSEVSTPSEFKSYFLTVQNMGAGAIVRTGDGLWRYSTGSWRQIARRCDTLFSVSQTKAWCVNLTLKHLDIVGTKFDGRQVTAHDVHGDLYSLWAGLFDDAWFSEKNGSFLGHVSSTGLITEVPTASPVHVISGTSNAVWFDEADGQHYGFIDSRSALHEIDAKLQYGKIESIIAARAGAWLVESFGSKRVIHHVNPTGQEDSFIWVSDVRSVLTAADGSAWITSDIFPTVLHLSEGGELSSYKLPCDDKHMRLVPAPNDGVWFNGYDPGCSGSIDSHGIRVGTQPQVEYTDYM